MLKKKSYEYIVKICMAENFTIIQYGINMVLIVKAVLEHATVTKTDFL